jgi:hypothetical protein
MNPELLNNQAYSLIHIAHVGSTGNVIQLQINITNEARPYIFDFSLEWLQLN